MTPVEHSGAHRTLADYIAILRRRKWIAILPLVLVPIAAYVYASQQPTVYAATAEVLLSRQDLGSSLSGATNPDVFTDADRYAQTQAAIARVPEVARRAIARSGLSQFSPGGLLASSSVAPRGNADLLQFSVQGEDPSTVARLASAYAAAYTGYRLQLDTAALASARRDLQRSIAALERKGATDTALYRDLTGKVQELRTMELLQTRSEVVRKADSGAQVAPTPRRDALLGVGLGLLLGLAAVFLWDALDRRVRDEGEIHHVLRIPLLARLPAPRSGGLGMLDDPSDVDADAVRRLRSSIEFANLDVRAKVIMVTSCVGIEGKTTTMSNLAVALARGGHTVALVDLDLRKPMVGRMFGLELRPGLADVAIGRIGLDRALVPIRIERGDVTLSRPSRLTPVEDELRGDVP
ncbi:MAG: P-loop NTPase, partial [Thermoleophilia bacterium]|nr:P-loop NTPase [Thermoleophilia bacterium]